MTFYGKVEYWNDRYTNDKEAFEWYQRYTEIRHLLPRPASRVLNLGCGNSRISEEMLKDGYDHIVNIDFSVVVIEQMKERYKDDANQEFECADVTRSIPYPDESFDLIFCKGTLDAIMCTSGAYGNTRIMMEECSRVLKKDGVMAVVSYGTKEDRMVYFEEIWDDVEIYPIPKPRIKTVDGKEGNGHHYVYVCKKKEGKQVEEDKEDKKDDSESTMIPNATAKMAKIRIDTDEEKKVSVVANGNDFKHHSEKN